jgi:CelD/BcsL family acetyltransferase involved in cellulose biosynthesis
MPSVIEINDIAALAEQRAAWHRLLAATPHASFFQTPEWLEVYWRFFGRGQKLRVLLVEDAGELCGIVPLVVKREPTRLGRLRVLTYPLHDWGSFYGPISADPTFALEHALQHVARTRRDWEVLDLRFVHGEEGGAARTAAALGASALPSQVTHWKEAAIVDMTSGWEAYWAARESKVRNNLRRHQKRMQELGRVELIRHRPRGEVYGESDPRFDLFDQCVAVAKRSWQGTSANGTTLSHDHLRDYFRAAHEAAARIGCLDMNLLTVDGAPVGFGYNYHYAGALEGIRIGYDPLFARAGAGNVLYLMMFQDSFARGDRRFDMGVGTLDIKRFWWTHTEWSHRHTHYPLSAPRAQLLRLKHWLFGSRVRTEVPIAETIAG